MPRLDDDLLEILTAHVSAARGEVVQLEGVEAVPLEGGFVAAAVDRLDLTLTRPNGERVVSSFVRKGCPAREIRALEQLAATAGTLAAPELVTAWSETGRPDDPAANGFISPFYPGASLNFGDTMPEAVWLTLARLHAASIDSAAVAWAWPYDEAHLERLVAGALKATATSERFRVSSSDWKSWLGRLERAGMSPILLALAASLPKCLVHGDIHPGNILAREDGSAVIIDWGNACLAPPMLDLANMIPIDSAEWHGYLAAYWAAGGAIDEATWRRGYWWARAAGAFMYLPWTVAHTDRAPVLIGQAETSLERLAELI